MYKNQLGMTLLEVLVAMTLMVIISAIAYASLNGLIDAKIHTDGVALNIRQELLTTQQLNRDIGAMIQRSVKNEFGEDVPAIRGGYTGIEFTKNSHLNSLNQRRSDLQRVHWYLNDGQLYRRVRDLLDLGGRAEWRTRKYLDDVSEISVNYVNTVGQESRIWPVENSQVPLQFIQFSVVLENDTTMTYYLRPVL